jgi:cytochrome oxidase assembly protein ShyY1
VYRFLLTGRWLALALVAVLLAAVCTRLGLWQFGRLDDRRADNDVVRANLDAPAVPVEDATEVGTPPGADEQWRPVTVRGSYVAGDQILVRFASLGSSRGVDVVAALRLDDGTYVLVDRGFLESPPGTPAGTPDRAEVPTAPTGTVEVTGRLRIDSDAPPEAVAFNDGTVRAISSAALAEVVDGPLRGGWVEALEERSAATGEASGPGVDLLGPEEPSTDSGPHLFYGLQWLLFGFLAVLGYFWFAYDEAHPRRRRSADEPPVDQPAAVPAEPRQR